MTLTQEEIEKLSKNLSKFLPQCDQKLVDDINSIIGYIDILNEVDTTGVESTVSVITSKNILKPDIKSKRDALPDELLSCSNQKVIGNQITLNNIME